jgi:hypothetical protein
VDIAVILFTSTVNQSINISNTISNGMHLLNCPFVLTNSYKIIFTCFYLFSVRKKDVKVFTRKGADTLYYSFLFKS